MLIERSLHRSHSQIHVKEHFFIPFPIIGYHSKLPYSTLGQLTLYYLAPRLIVSSIFLRPKTTGKFSTPLYLEPKNPAIISTSRLPVLLHRERVCKVILTLWTTRTFQATKVIILQPLVVHSKRPGSTGNALSPRNQSLIVFEK